MTQTQTHNFQNNHERKRNTIRRKSVVNTRKMIRQTHHQASIMMNIMIVITDANYVRGRAIEKRILSNYAPILRKSC